MVDGWVRKGRSGMILAAGLGLAGCVNSDATLDWDLRNNGGSTAAAAQAYGNRPSPDARGVISYPTYQVVVARRGDTVATVASRIGMAPDQLARFNALSAGDSLREGEILALPGGGVAPAAVPGAVMPGTTAGGIDVAAIATTAIDRTGQPAASTGAAALPFSTTGSGPAPVRYQVKRGETAYTIARQFNISAKALADWNGLPSDLSVREGQFLIIPSAADIARQPVAETLPGQGSPTPTPPSAAAPLPQEKPVTPQAAAQIKQQAPDLSASASGSAMSMPIAGKIVKPYDGKGIDIAGTAGAPVKAASSGTVAVVTKDASSGTLIVIVKHEGGLLTVYAGLDSAAVAKGASVSRGQSLGTLRSGNPATLHFEVRQGQQAVDPMGYL